MFKSYLKTTLRNIKRQKGYSIINLSGLAVGLACTIIILLWVRYEYSWDKAKRGAKKFYIYRSDNDQYVPEKCGRVIADKLGVKEMIIPGGGHLNIETGYDKFLKLFEDIKGEL